MFLPTIVPPPEEPPPHAAICVQALRRWRKGRILLLLLLLLLLPSCAHSAYVPYVFKYSKSSAVNSRPSSGTINEWLHKRMPSITEDISSRYLHQNVTIFHCGNRA